MSTSIDWLVFDLGGVLVDVQPAETTIADLARRSDTPAARIRPALRERFTETPFSIAERFQVGALDEAGFHTALNDILERPLAYDVLIDRLESVLRGEKPATLDLLRRLAANGQRLACYSNTNTTHWRYMRSRYRLFDSLAHAFASQELGLAKPDRCGFDRVAASLDTVPGRCLLVDDRPVNVDGARAAGWQALCFRDAAVLERDLSRLGVEAVPA